MGQWRGRGPGRSRIGQGQVSECIMSTGIMSQKSVYRCLRTSGLPTYVQPYLKNPDLESVGLFYCGIHNHVRVRPEETDWKLEGAYGTSG